VEDIIKPGYTRISEIISKYTGYHDIPSHILQNACERGTAVHEICESLILGFGCPDINPLYEGYVESFNLWHDQYKTCESLIPDRWYDDDNMITGKADCILKRDGKYILIDFKTSASESKSWMLQGGAYALLFQKNENFQLDEINFVKLDKRGDAPQIKNYNVDRCIELFEMALKLHLEIYQLKN
jgi:ATP-dependent exoDNAse (exonuclease V) beta subunit